LDLNLEELSVSLRSSFALALASHTPLSQQPGVAFEMALFNLLVAVLMLLNALAILNEERFLSKRANCCSFASLRPPTRALSSLPQSAGARTTSPTVGSRA
jgi:hypothetical protein